jgi:hypothetical protein
MTVVIGIIMLLLTISVIAYRYIEASAARNRTRAALHDLEAMTAELDRTGGMIRLVGTTNMSLYQTGSQTSSPGDVSASGAGRGTANSNCATVLSYLVLVPANQQAIAQLPVKSLVPNSARTINSIQISAVADGWGNPIIFVPPSGLVGVSIGASANSSGTISNTNSVTITSPDHRWFWASAGPDGNFSNGDDNIYSFEK